MDGSNRRVIIRRNIHWPNGLTIDYSAQKIYWTDASLFYIDKANYDGSDRQSILRSAPNQCSLEHPFALALYADKLYWTDWKKRGILSTNKNNGLRCPVIKKSNTSPMDIRAYVAKRQVPRPGKCFALEYSFVRNLRKQQICSDATTLVSPLNDVWETSAEIPHRWRVTTHPRRPRRSQSGREKMCDGSFQAQAEKPLAIDSHRTISKRSSEYWLPIGHKNALYQCAQSVNSISWVLFVNSYTTAIRVCTLRSSDATATRTSLKKWIWVLSVFFAIIPTHLLCQM